MLFPNLRAEIVSQSAGNYCSLPRNQYDISAIATVATVRPTQGLKFFTPKTGAAVSALAGVHDDFYFVNEFHWNTKNKSPANGAFELKAS